MPNLQAVDIEYVSKIDLIVSLLDYEVVPAKWYDAGRYGWESVLLVGTYDNIVKILGDLWDIDPDYAIDMMVQFDMEMLRG